MKIRVYSSKRAICILKIYTNYKLPVFKTKFLQFKIWKLLSNSKATFNLENVNLLNNPNVNPKNGVAYKKTCIESKKTVLRSIVDRYKLCKIMHVI